MTEPESLYIIRRRACHLRGKCTGPMPMHPDEWCGCRVHTENEMEAWKSQMALKLLSFVAAVFTAIVIWVAVVN